MGRVVFASLVFAALGLSPARVSAQPYHLDDSLLGSTSGNRTGGSLGADGWTITGADDRIWYALPRLASGYVEFTVANITPAVLPLPDHEIFAMYEDGYGLGEPIDYGAGFRQNHYKALLRIYGAPEPTRLGFMKLMWGICPSGSPGVDACGCGSFFEEPFGDPGAWTGAPVRVRVEWGDGRSRLLRDGVEVVGVDWTGFEFGPSELHMMLGSPRNATGLSGMPLGATFSNLVVDGQRGPLATCGGTTPDAGVPVDAGACSAGALAAADVTAASWESGVYPDPSDLNVEGDATNPTAVVYLRFAGVAGPVTSATLTMNTSSGGSAGGGSGQICRVDAAAWDESTLTWTTRPTVSSMCSGAARRVGASERVSWDVTPLVAPGRDITLAVVSTDPDGAHYLSREAGGCALGPRLDVVLAPGVDAGTDAGSADAGATGRDGAVPDVDASTMGTDAGARTDAGGHSTPLSGGCGCTAAGGRRGAGLVTLLVLALALVHRRRRFAR